MKVRPLLLLQAARFLIRLPLRHSLTPSFSRLPLSL